MSPQLTVGAIRRSSWEHPYLSSLVITAAVTGIAFATFPALQAANLDVLYLLAVLVIALRWGERPAVLAAAVSAIVFDYCFISPRFSFAITDLAYTVSLAGFLVVAVVTSRLAAHARALLLEQSARERAEALSQAKDLVLHKIAHELRAPLTAVVGWTQLLRQAEMDGEERERALAALENGAEILRALVNDLWDASRAVSGKLAVELRPMQLRPCVQKALDVVVHAAKTKGIRLDSELQLCGDILGDELRIEQLVTNLVWNAIKFTPSGGSVNVTLSQVGTEAEIKVSDTGPGIASEFLPHLFDPFTQANPEHSTGGLGLGLAIVKYLVEAHHGRISVTSGDQRGSTFTVRLPLLATDRSGGQELIAPAI